MTELFPNVREELREAAHLAWEFVIRFHNPRKAAEFLNSFIAYNKNSCTEEEIEFLQFYFKTQMEMMKK